MLRGFAREQSVITVGGVDLAGWRVEIEIPIRIENPGVVYLRVVSVRPVPAERKPVDSGRRLNEVLKGLHVPLADGHEPWVRGTGRRLPSFQAEAQLVPVDRVRRNLASG